MTEKRVVFADSSFLIALLAAEDEWHARALGWQRWVQHQQVRIVTTEAVLWEWLNQLSHPGIRTAAHQAYLRVHADPEIEIMAYDQELIARAVELYGSRQDKSWSLTGCLSFSVMDAKSIAQALTSDHHFEQAGFEALLQRESGA